MRVRAADSGAGARIDHVLSKIKILRICERCRLTVGTSFRLSGRTRHLENGGRLEHAQQMAAHESPPTTKLYDRTKDEITIGGSGGFAFNCWLVKMRFQFIAYKHVQVSHMRLGRCRAHMVV